MVHQLFGNFISLQYSKTSITRNSLKQCKSIEKWVVRASEGFDKGILMSTHNIQFHDEFL